MENKTLKHLIKYQKIYLVILLILVLTIPNLIRWTNNNPTIIGAPSYYNLNVVKGVDSPIFYGNPYLSLLSLNVTHNIYIYKLIPLILGILSFFLLFDLIKKLGLSSKNQFFLLLFLILSPAFIYTFTILNHYSLFIFLILLGFFLLFNKNGLSNYLSIPIFLIIPFFDIFSSILTLLLLATYYYIQKEKINFVDFQIKLPAIVIIISTLFNIKKPFLLGINHSHNIITTFFSDLGGLFGLSLFVILLATIGIFATWKRKKFFINYFFLGLLVLMSLYQNSNIIYLNFLVVSLAALGINCLISREWKIQIIKNITLFLLLLGILFSTLTIIDSLSQLPPNIQTKEAFTYFKENSPSYKLVFSHPQDSYLIEYYSGRPAFIHYHDSDFKKREQIVNQALNSTYVIETFPLLDKNDISHIYLSAPITANLPTERGLLFILQNERFKRIYTQKGIQIWEFK